MTVNLWSTSKFVRNIMVTGFAEGFSRYLNYTDEVRAGIQDMVEILASPTSTTDETHAALATLSEALFPTEPVDISEP